MLPFYIFYSMFGFQRVGDLIWAAADSHSRGFLLGATAGRTTLSGEGLQHQDGIEPPDRLHDSELRRLRSLFRLRAGGDPAGRHAPHAGRPGGRVLLHHGDERELRSPGVAGRRRGGDPARACTGCASGDRARRRRGARAAARQRHDPARSHRRRAKCWNRTGTSRPTCGASPASPSCGATAWRSSAATASIPTANAAHSYVEQCLAGTAGPVIAASDYVSAVADLIRPCVPRRYVTLGTDGFGRSDTRAALRDFFEVGAAHVVVAALSALADEGGVARSVVSKAIKQYGIASGGAPAWER